LCAAAHNTASSSLIDSTVLWL